jgi:hypothetical protein
MFREEIQNTVSHFNMGLFGYLDLISNPEVPGSNPLVPSFLFFAQSLGFAVSGFLVCLFQSLGLEFAVSGFLVRLF